MAEALFVTVAAGAQDVGGTLSMLSGFIELVQGPQFPLRQQLFVVARLTLTESELGRPLLFVIKAEHEDGEQLARVEIGARVERAATYDHRLGFAMNLVVPIALDIRRAGLYVVTVSDGGEELGRTSLLASAQLPTV